MNKKQKYDTIPPMLFWKRLILCVFLIAILIGGGSLLQQHLFGGFRESKIFSLLMEEETFSVDAPSDDILDILNQPFRYLDKGSQAYVFESQDKRFVIKFIRYSRYHVRFWLPYLRYFSFYKNYLTSRIQHKKQRYRDSIYSYKVADKILREKTDVLYTHLFRTNFFRKKILLKDRLGRRFYFDLDKTGFLLQKKAIPLERVLLKAKKAKDLAQTRLILVSFIDMIHFCYSHNITIKDYNCLKNAGYLSGRVINMDLGSFFIKKDFNKKNEYVREMRHFTRHFTKWAKKNYPEALAIFEEEINRIIRQRFVCAG